MLRETYVGPVCSPVQSGQVREPRTVREQQNRWKIWRHLSDVYLRNYIALVFIIFYAAKFSYILHNILYSCPLFCRLSLSHSHLYHINLITFEMFGGATIENGFATLAMCSASFGQLLMVLSICPLPSALFSLHSSPHSLPVPLPLYSSRASHVLHAQQF